MPGKGKPLKLGKHTVQPSASHKYLGVHINKQLSGKVHAAYALARGAQNVGQIARLSSITKGLCAQQKRILYYSTVAPSMLYAVDTFIKPYMGKTDSGRDKGLIRAANGFQQVQRQMALQITGAMRSTPTDILLVHAGMWPTRMLMNKLCKDYPHVLRATPLPPSFRKPIDM